MALRAARSERTASGRYRIVWLSGDPPAQRNGLRFSLALERLEKRIARARLLHPSGVDAGLGPRFYPSPCQHTESGRRDPAMVADISLHRSAGRTFLSRLGTESARTPGRTARGSGDRLSTFRAFTLQQTIGAFQLALRLAGYDCGDFLRPGLARAPARGCIDHHTRQRRLDMGIVVLIPFKGKSNFSYFT